MRIKSQKDFFAGLMFTGVGVAFAWGATNYTIGEGARMGPGYFPLMLGILLADPGPARDLRRRWWSRPRTARRSAASPGSRWASSSAPTSLFGILLGGLPQFGIPAIGLIVAIYALTFIAAWPATNSRPRKWLILATILAVGSYLAFVVLLKLQFPVWPSFITG